MAVPGGTTIVNFFPEREREGDRREELHDEMSAVYKKKKKEKKKRFYEGRKRSNR